MSHFSVAVFTEPNGKTLEQLLAPYQENNMGDCPKEYLEFHSTEEEYKKEYEEDGTEMVKTPDGRLLYPWDEEFRIKGEIGHGSNTHKVPDDCVKVEVKHKYRFPDFETFMKEWAGYKTRDPEAGKFGYWENPNRKWDWYQIGGRSSGRLMLKAGATSGERGSRSWLDRSGPLPPNMVDSARVADIDWEGMALKERQDREKWWAEAEKEQPVIRYIQYGIEKDMTKEQYLEKANSFGSFAVILPDGKWYEKGKMGWWACVSNEEAEWDQKYKERFLDTANPEWTLTIVDCHI